MYMYVWYKPTHIMYTGQSQLEAHPSQMIQQDGVQANQHTGMLVLNMFQQFSKN